MSVMSHSSRSPSSKHVHVVLGGPQYRPGTKRQGLVTEYDTTTLTGNDHTIPTGRQDHGQTKKVTPELECLS